MSDELLRVSKLGVVLDEKVVLHDLSFSLGAQETLVILGPNGAGKTVLLRALLGLLPHQGDVVWKKGITRGYVPQRIPLNPELPVTVADFFALKGTSARSTAESLSHVGLDEKAFSKKPLGLISSGQFQRVLIAWALVDHPDVLIVDEPTAGIDIGGEEIIHDLFERTRRERGLAIILVTHDLSVVYGDATNVLCLNANAPCYGPPRDVLTPETLKSMYGRDIKLYEHSHG